jgi:hypothetical protein
MTTWYDEPPEAMLKWFEGRPAGAPLLEDGLGELWFSSPETGDPEHIHVTRGPDTQIGHLPIWHIEVSEDEASCVVRPSIHYRGHFHSPNPVVFSLARVVRVAHIA